MRNGVAACSGVLVGVVFAALYPSHTGCEMDARLLIFICIGSLARQVSIYLQVGSKIWETESPTQHPEFPISVDHTVHFSFLIEFSSSCCHHKWDTFRPSTKLFPTFDS